ncbi:type II secretion system F family protein [Streptacidiphilus sp. EB129]|uniref:type II secretion system F family protein n=1 Tax=Streptacidiphilus sp. EB129 TaxID=3156262 RepID=UPI0035116576
MIDLAPVLLTGATVGAGITVAAAGLMPGRTDLGDVLSRLDANRLDVLEPRRHAGAVTVTERLGARVLAQVGEQVLRIPRRELELTGRSAAWFIGKKLTTALAAMLMPMAGVALYTAAIGPPPVAIPLLGALAFAVVAWFLPDIKVRQEAAEARTEFRTAVASYLELVGLERAADAGPTESLRRAAEVGDGWVFQRIRDAIVRAELAGIPPWDGLRQLSTEIGVPELGAPADIIALAGEEGAAVYSTLQAQARSLRGQLLTDQQADANTASETMVAPVAALVILMTLYIAFPAMMRVINS